MNTQWLIIEHQDGRLEDVGFVQVKRGIPLIVMNEDGTIDDLDRYLQRNYGCIRFERDDFKRQIALCPADICSQGEVMRHLECKMKDGSSQVFHWAEGAVEIVRERGFLLPMDQFRSA